MKNEIGMRLRDKMLPLVLFPAIVGMLTGVLIFIFKVTSSHVMHKSAEIYALVRENPIYLPALVAGAAAIGLLSALILRWAKECRGGGIPTAVASIRGLIPLKWAQGIFALFTTSMLTYIAGVPLGNEGPSVQMGAATGKGATSIFGKRYKALERYNMTGGACSGFAIATGAPLAGIVFAMEEAHRRFSPTIFIVAATSVISGTMTSELLSICFGVDTTFFNLAISETLPLQYLWIPVVIGVMCGVFANLFTKLYHFVRQRGREGHVRLPFAVNMVIIFTVVAFLGFASGDLIGSGHSLIDKILEGHAIWYMVLIAFVVRAVVMIHANNGGISGGLFVPTLAFGAMIASLIADGCIALGLVGTEYYAIFVVVGMASFLSSSSKIPLTALVFAAEGLCAASNLLPAVVGVAIAYVVAELIGKPSFADTVIEAKTHDAHAGKKPIVVDTHMRVQPGAFAVGKELRDILWPHTCTVLSIHKNNSSAYSHSAHIESGDLLHLHYQTYDTTATFELLSNILGEQPEDDFARVREGEAGHIVPAAD